MAYFYEASSKVFQSYAPFLKIIFIYPYTESVLNNFHSVQVILLICVWFILFPVTKWG